MTTSPGEIVWTQFWQVTAVVVAVGLISMGCCRKRPHLAYVLWLVVLVKTLVPPLWSSPTSLFSWATRDVSAGVLKISVPIAAPSIPPPPGPLEMHQDELVGDDIPRSQPSLNPESELSDLPLESPVISMVRMMVARSATVPGLIWFIGTLTYACCVVLFTIRFWRTLQTSRVPENEGLTNLFLDLSKRLRVRHVVRLWVTSEPIGPLTFGWIWPTVVMPESLVIHRSLAEVEPLLAHELVHVRRGDALVGLVQVVSQCLWWFHPLIWWANRRIVFERERCCDEEVVAGLAMEPARYARGLLSVLELKQQWRRLAISPGASSFEINQRRLEHIMSSGNGFPTRTPRAYWLVVIVLMLLLVPGASLTGLSSGLEDPQDKSQPDQIRKPIVEADKAQANAANPKPAEAADDKAKLAGAEMHIVGVYGPKDSETKRIDVEVLSTDKPVVLVLTSYYSVNWHVTLADGARVEKVIAAGYSPQEIEGLPADIPLLYRTYYPTHNRDYFFAYKSDSPEYWQMVERLNQMIGLPISTVQMKEEGTAFVVDGKRGLGSTGKEQDAEKTKGVESTAKSAKSNEDPAADVADFPSQELQAGGDANKRYFLVGPTQQAEPPTEGYKLIVILPGGDGSADFHPFVKRIYKHALSDQYLIAQPIAIKWTPEQQIVWPTKTSPVDKMKFGTEEFIEAVIEDVAKKHKLDRKKVYSLSWSSSGHAAYATSLQNSHSVTGSFIAMSVFRPDFLPPLDQAKGHAYYLYHSQLDRVCPYRMAEQAAKSLAKNGATVRLETYEGGHGWASGNVYEDIRAGINWLESPE